MTTVNTLALSNIVDVNIQVSPLAAPRNTFNQALIIGTSTHIANATKLKKYTEQFATEMAADGFLTTDPEYIAMQIYFSQSPAPKYGWVGRKCATALKTATVNNGTTGYAVGDELTIVQSGASGGKVKVATVDADGTILTITNPSLPIGEGYSVASALATTGGTGTGATLNITAVGESFLEAVESCRNMNFDWYVAICPEAAKSDHLAIAGYIESASPDSLYAFTTTDADVPTNTAGNIFAALKALGYGRTIGQYTTTQSAAYPNNIYAICAIVGYAMGQNNGLANSAFTLKFKNEIGIAIEPLDPTSISNIEGNNGNLYLYYGNYYKIFEQGVMASGIFFDQIINRDMLKSNIQLNVMDLLYQNPKIPQTDAGVNQIVHAINEACDDAVTIGYLAPGTWTGSPILNLNTDDVLPKGYLTQAVRSSEQSDADRAARKCPNIYVAVKEAGAIHSCLIGVYVNV